ncbi:hypothetical protein BDV95DRAFT_477272, partial [Massariosphaeria phaeospora]
MAHPGTLHRYTSGLVAFEHSPSPAPPNASSPTNTLLFIGGLGDGLLTVHYPATLAAALPPHWSLAEVLLSSSYKGWGTGSLARDAREIAECVRYFRGRRPGGKVVCLGHSTGCQGVVEMVVRGGAGGVAIDGAILQGGVSDREAWADMSGQPAVDALVATTTALIAQGRGDAILPDKEIGHNAIVQGFDAPVSASRAHALLAFRGADDYFSSDLSDDVLRATLGCFPATTHVLFLLGERDPYVPEHVDKAALLGRW